MPTVTTNHGGVVNMLMPIALASTLDSVLSRVEGRGLAADARDAGE